MPIYRTPQAPPQPLQDPNVPNPVPPEQMGGNQAIDFVPHAQQLLSGYWLERGNPYAQGLLDQQRREAERTYAGQQAALDQASMGAGRFGGSVYRGLAGSAAASHQQNLADAQNQTLAGLYEAERGRMMEALGGLGGYETAAADRTSREQISAEQVAAQRWIAELQAQAQRDVAARQAAAQHAAARASANAQLRAAELNAALQRDLQAGQLGFSREQLTGELGLAQQQLAAQLGMHGLDAWNARALQAADLEFGRDQLAANLMGQMGQLGLAEAGLLGDIGAGIGSEQLGALGMAGQMGLGWGDQQQGILGMMPGLEQAGYFGINSALGAQQAIGQQNANAAGNRWRDEMNQWQWETQNEQNALNDYFSMLAALGGMGGTADTHGIAPPNAQVPSANPWAGAIQGGLGGWFAGQGMQAPQQAQPSWNNNTASGPNSWGAPAPTPGWQGFGPGVNFT